MNNQISLPTSNTSTPETQICTSRPLSPEQMTQYHQEGFVIVPKFFDIEEIEPVQRALEDNPDLGGAWTIRKNHNDVNTFQVSMWTELDNALLGVIPRMARMVDASSTLLGEECYHWHSKIIKKQPGKGVLEWHQDYDHWYNDGCLFPQLVTCMIAITTNNQQNGCLKILKKSHLMGRINHIIVEKMQNGIEPSRLAEILARFEVVHCEMNPGDALFFHANTIHSSQPNKSNSPRILMYSTYNAASNEPFILKGQEHHVYQKLIKLPDSIIQDGGYDSVLENHKFHMPESKENPGLGIFYRHFEQ
ncbi:MAG: phytanoyl-CoA dioxygenase family protein [Rhizonema sp. NSF051]|nr:phytanoyl-CoA dioxygenase family protein [Rhizonema sp. NSF051]